MFKLINLKKFKSQHVLHQYQFLSTSFILLNKINVKTKRLHENTDRILDELEGKILFNSVLEDTKLKLGYNKNRALENKIENIIKKQQAKLKEIQPFPSSLKYITEEDTSYSFDPKPVEIIEEKHGITQFPFAKTDAVEKSEVIKDHVREESEHVESEEEVPANWMSDYEVYDEDYDKEGETESWKFNYGTTNPNSKVSNIPCGGCGALLHCKDTAIPGFIPREIFEKTEHRKLPSITCQRCHFLKNYNLALQVRVSPDEYPKILSQIQDKRALVILMIDLFDFPCSLWPNIIDIIGNKRPVIIAANKIDLFPQDSQGFLSYIQEQIKNMIKSTSVASANIKHVALISAKTGYGIEELINKLHTIWKYKGDVYLIGCTNTGKSTLFNALLQSDYCKIQAVDLIQRATTSPWPGTTLNLLKFPILRPSGWRLYVRTRRLISQRQEHMAEKALRNMQFRETKNPEFASLIGHIGQTFVEKEPTTKKDPFSVGLSSQVKGDKYWGINENSDEYKQSKWCYDTPGVLQPDQILNILTAEELMLTLPKQIITPKTFYLKPGLSIFIAGLGRLDFVESTHSARFTVFASKSLPVTVCETRDAELLYEKLVGTEIMVVPQGSSDRLNKWPHLEAKEFKVVGSDSKKSVADVVLSSAGWIAFTSPEGVKSKLKAWTPEGRGIYFRQPALLPHAVNLRGKRLRDSPAYKIENLIYQK